MGIGTFGASALVLPVTHKLKLAVGFSDASAAELATKHGLSEIQLDFVVYSFWTCQCHVDISIASSEGVGFDDDRADISVDRRRLETEK